MKMNICRLLERKVAYISNSKKIEIYSEVVDC